MPAFTSVIGKGDPFTSDSRPWTETLNPETAPVPFSKELSDTNRNWLLGLRTRSKLLLLEPLGNGDPGTGVRLPLALREYTSTPPVAANTKLPAQFVVRAETIPLAAKGDPGTAERDPLCEIWNAATSCWLSTPANRNWPFALTFNPAKELFKLNGPPGTSRRLPVFGEIAKT